MYRSTYIFYKFEEDGVTPTDVKAKDFGDPHSEKKFIRNMRKDGYRTYRAPEDVFRILIAAGAEVI